MRKILFISAVLAAVFAMAATSFAWCRGGYGCGYGYGPGYAPAAYTPEQTQKITAFQQSIQPQQQKMFQLRNELWTLRNQQNPDWNAITAKQREMFELRTQIQKQAVDSGVAGMGYGYGYGKRGRGMGRW
jgi:hypothetical protein